MARLEQDLHVSQSVNESQLEEGKNTVLEFGK